MTPWVVQATAPHDVGTTVVTLVGAAMIGVLSARLSVLAARIRANAPRAQVALWEYFGFAGLAGTLYGGLLLAGSVLEVHLPFLEGVLLAFTVLVALALREAHFNATLSNAELDRLGQYRVRRGLEATFVLGVVIVVAGPVVSDAAAFTVLAGVTAFAVVVYGLYYQVQRSRSSATRGTLIDTMVRQSVPVLVFAGGAVIAPVLALGPTSETVAQSVSAVFVVVTATALMTVTIKLSQHLSAVR